ncbi:vacuolar protein sorting 13C isoform X2 [Anticarsia gemmatalis]|uniref:vacuolar protein sorting 13C isoform X2 n=1 Tax=Anticarsia gemmatalis TaxID=129554 RepID=UPI003F76AFAD
MVFESIVVDVLNRFLGDYVENLNRSQLKLGIWGGDVVLENLILKQNALEELNIPVQTTYGHLGKLVLKIPWKNLYGASVEATVERLFLIVNPTAEVKYDPQKEEKMALAAKQAELARVEEAKKKEAEKDQNKLDETFVEKLVTQIIKNVQLKITDIHIRYEDSITNPKAPFSFGITLHNLSVHTTDENWKQTVIQEAVTKIFKILALEGLAIYWNPATEVYSKTSSNNIKDRLHKEIATKSYKPDFYKYALGPINATAKLKLNPKPEADLPKFSIPKVILSLHMEQLSVSLTKSQYQDMMLLADSMDRMNRQTPYRKYRPDLQTYKRHYKEWWQFAYKCILEEEVRRRRRNWDWTHMLAHRQLCKDYASAYQCKLSSKGKVSTEQQCVLNEAEKTLDLFNLVVIRQKIEMEVERLGKMEEEAKKSRGWFSGWWYGGGSKDDELAEGTAIMKQFEKAMTPDEKEKLFRAIDYQENSAPLHLPSEYVAVESYFQLDKLQLSVTDQTEVLKACVDHVEVDMKQRPSANALRVDVHMKAFSVTGVHQGEFIPRLVTSKEVTQDVNLLNVVFETNPLDGLCDQRVKVLARPLQIVYDAQTVIEIVNVFKPPTESTALTTLQAAAENKLSDLKEKSALGMQYAVHHHTFIDLDIDIAASYIIVPQTGVYRGNESCAVVKLGAIKVKSEPRSQALDVHKLYREGLADEDILKEITHHSYDKMALELTEMQIVIASPGEDWQTAIASNDEATPLHLLQPTNLVIQIHKCLITDDPRLPKVKIRGELQKIAISVSEDRLLTLCEILVSMPLPQSEESTQLKPSESKGSSLSLLKYLDPAEKQKRESIRSLKEKKLDEQSVQLTEVEAFFIMKELVLSINRKTLDSSSKGYDKFLVFSLTLLQLTAVQKTFTLEATVRLGAVHLQHFRSGRKALDMIETLDVKVKESEPTETVERTSVLLLETTRDQYLFNVTYSNVDKKCPEFRSHYGSVEQMIELDFTNLRVLLHLEGLNEILVIVNEYQTRLQAIQRTVDRTANAGQLETIMEDEEFNAAKSKVSVSKPSRRKQVESIQLKVNVKIGAIEIVFATDMRPLSVVSMKGATAGLVIKASYTQVDCAIASIKVEDLNPDTVHKEIMKVLGGDVMNVQIVMYNTDQIISASQVDMSIDAQINCLRIIFLNWFVTSMLEFLNNFQTAQQAIIDASSQAADAARANVQTAYDNSTKLALKVRLAAPIIIVPENSKSYNAMLVDLGRMNLNNKFVDLGIANVNNRVTIDELTLELEDMKVSCVTLTEDYQTSQERKLLRPTSFKLFVKRSLSSWYETLPDLDISGRLNTIAIAVGHSDYKSIMKILNQNLTEGQKKVEEKPLQRVSNTTSKVQVKAQISKVQTRSTLASLTIKEEKKKPRTTIKFSFTMDSFVIDLLTTTSTTVSTANDIFVKDVELARFCLALLSVKGRMLSDNSMQTSVLLVDCTLDDTRPGRGAKITRYLERRRASKGDSMDDTNESASIVHDKIRSMIDITYTMKNNDTFIDMRIFSFNLILAMDFLNKIAEFMTTGLADDVPKPPKEEIKLSKSVTDKSVEAMSKRKSVASTQVIDSQRPSMMTVNVKIEQPDIILVESLEDQECDALVLNMEARFKLRHSEERMVADGGISGLQMVIRTLGADTSAAPRYLLAPAHLSLAVSQPPDCGMHVDLAVTDIVINVSPEIIGLLNRVISTMTSREEDLTEQVDKAIFYNKLWDIQPFKPNAYWFLKTGKHYEAEEAINIADEEDVATPARTGEICLLSCPQIVFSLEMEIGNETIPVLVMQASLTGQVKDWSSDFYLESTWAMQVSYYNIERAVWEPLIEPVEVLKDNQYKHVPWELKMEVVMRPKDTLTIDTSDEANNLQVVAQRQANKTITLSSSELLEITFTRTGMEVLTLLGNSFSAAVAEDAQVSKSKTDDLTEKKYSGAPYVLHNCTGLTCKLMLKDNHDFSVYFTEADSTSDYREVVLEPGACVPLQLKHGGLNLMKLNEPPPPLKLSVKIVEISDEVHIPVERADKRYFSLAARAGGAAGGEQHVALAAAAEPRGLISDVVMQDAALHIYLRSVVQVRSHRAPIHLQALLQPGGEQHVALAAAAEPRGLISDVVMQDAALHIYLRSVVQVRSHRAPIHLQALLQPGGEQHVALAAAAEPRGLISDVVMQDAALHIYLRSVVQVRSHRAPIHLQALLQPGGEQHVALAAAAEPRGLISDVVMQDAALHIYLRSVVQVRSHRAPIHLQALLQPGGEQHVALAAAAEPRGLISDVVMQDAALHIYLRSVVQVRSHRAPIHLQALLQPGGEQHVALAAAAEPRGLISDVVMQDAALHIYLRSVVQVRSHRAPIHLQALLQPGGEQHVALAAAAEPRGLISDVVMQDAALHIYLRSVVQVRSHRAPIHLQALLQPGGEQHVALAAAAEPRGLISDVVMQDAALHIYLRSVVQVRSHRAPIHLQALLQPGGEQHVALAAAAEPRGLISDVVMQDAALHIYLRSVVQVRSHRAPIHLQALLQPGGEQHVALAAAAEPRGLISDVVMQDAALHIYLRSVVQVRSHRAPIHLQALLQPGGEQHVALAAAAEPRGLISDVVMQDAALHIYLRSVVQVRSHRAPIHLQALLQPGGEQHVALAAAAEPRGLISDVVMQDAALHIYLRSVVQVRSHRAPIHLQALLQPGGEQHVALAAAAEPRGLISDVVMQDAALHIYLRSVVQVRSHRAPIHLQALLQPGGEQHVALAAAAEPRGLISDVVMQDAALHIYLRSVVQVRSHRAPIHLQALLQPGGEQHVALAAAAEPRGLISDVVMQDAALHIYLRSVVQVRSHRAPIHLQALLQPGGEQHVALAAAAEPRGLISDVVMQDAALHIYLRSVVQVRSHRAPIHLQALLQPGGEQHVALAAAAEPRGLISDVVMQDAALHIYLRSVVQVRSHRAPIHLQALLQPGGEQHVALAAAAEPRGLISDVVMQDAALHIYLRSVVQVRSHRAPIHLQALLQPGGEQHVALAAAAEPRGLISDVVMQDAALHIYLRSVVQVRSHRAPIHLQALLQPGGEQHVALAAAAEPRGLISDVVMQDAALHIYLRSVVQVTNTLSVNVSVYYMTLSGNEVRLLGEVKPGDILRLPLQAVHTPTAELFFSVEGFTVSVSPFIWRELQHEVKISKLLQCDSKDKNTGEKFYLKAVGKMEQVFYEHTTRHTFASSCYDIVLKPAVKLQNCLPVDIVVSQLGLKRTQVFKPGEMFHLSHLSPNKASIVVLIQNYLDKCWVCTKNLPDNETELSVWSFQSHDSPSVMTLDLGMHSVDMEGTQVLSLYCPFWMLNKTGFTLCYRNVDETGNVIFHPKDYKEPILFSFRAKNFFGKKKAAIRVEFGEWSDKFSLDVPGSSGVVLCKHEGRTYQVAVTNQLTFNSLTKMVIFTPYFLIINEAPFGIQYQELHRSGDPWATVNEKSSAPLWPVVETADKLLRLRVACSTDIAAPFLYTEQHSVCLKLNNEFGGLHVEVQLTEGGTYITIRQYRDGHAPALLVNFSPYKIIAYEKENVNVRELPSMHQMLYTWDNPAGPRTLIFEGHKRKEIENELRKDGIGEYMINETTKIYWVSFLDGLQRVILFTDDSILATGAHTMGEAELLDTELQLSMQGIGLSLVNDPEHLEIVYISISNSGIIWEQCKIGARRFKKIDGPRLQQLEDAYQRYITAKIVSDEPPSPKVLIDEKTEVHFEEMRILKPTPRILRRTLEPGLWASYGLTAHSRTLHAKLHRLQIDQQLPLPTFPVVLAPVPPPRSVANDDPHGMKPFIEVSIVERMMEHSKVRQYKYYKVLIQEFHVKVDMGLINALMGMFPQRSLTEQEALEAFLLDLEKAGQPLEAVAMGVAFDLKNFYDNLHLSPLKVHVSFSLGGTTQLPTFIGTVLQSIGVTLTDMNDVVFKLSYYERNYEFLSQKELIAQVQNHYTGQALKQLYVLVLGLDVIGNPYGLVVGLKKGVEDLFYEPFQGAIQGPGEFAEGLFLGVRSLVGHTVGGAAGAVSRITGAMGHGLAALSLDKDYQRRRRDNINKPPANLQEGLARSGKGLVMGVVDGVTGVFTKPIEGAREQGVEGFFKGLGKGAVGLVARPTAGVVDFASGSLDAVKRAADMSEEVTKRRPARYMPPDAGVRPYSRLHAEGYKMLSELEKGKYVSTDTYQAHVWVIAAKEVVMCTDKRILYIEKNNVFGGWQIVWTYLWTELPEVPTAVNKGVYIPTMKKKVLGMFPTSGSGKVIFLYDESQKKYLLAQCQRLMQAR